jgi:hypothetical protein
MLRVKPPWSASVRLLDERDRGAVLAICDRDPVTNVFVSSRVRSLGLEPGRLGAQMWGHAPSGRLESLCYSGANLVPVAATPDAVVAFADRALRQGRRCSSVVGSASAVQSLWGLLRPHWGPARRDPPGQPVMVTLRGRRWCRRTRWSGGSGRTRSTSCGRPAWPCSPRRSASRRPSATAAPPTGPGWSSSSAAAGPSPGSRAARSSSRRRSARSRRRCARCRASGCAAVPRPGPGRAGHGRGRRRGGPLDRPAGLAVRQRLQHPGPRGLPPGGFTEAGQLMSVLF